MEVLKEMGLEGLQHPPYSPDLASSDFHLFAPLKELLEVRNLNMISRSVTSCGWFKELLCNLVHKAHTLVDILRII
jgi:hypothetical protein